MHELVARAHAKINLGLRVGRKRPDGYHEVLTVIAPIALHDTVSVGRVCGGITLAPLKCRTSTPGLRRAVPWDRRNLAYRAARAFFAASGLEARCRIRIAKRIPVGAGLGGGSSDAAAVLACLNHLFGRPLPGRRLRAVAASLGSDVPALLFGRPCVARGRGERLSPLALPPLDLVLCLPGYPVATARAYAELDRRRRQRLTSFRVSPKILARRLWRAELDKVAAQLWNSFEPVVFGRHPDLGRAKQILLAHGAYAAALSGSGSTVYGLVRAKGWKDPMAALARHGFHCVRTHTI
jgi:4-diphosphocytidyl-2-C-methyl-D-erythritol kinase